jgi:hypothetical protein
MRQLQPIFWPRPVFHVLLPIWGKPPGIKELPTWVYRPARKFFVKFLPPKKRRIVRLPEENFQVA